MRQLVLPLLRGVSSASPSQGYIPCISFTPRLFLKNYAVASAYFSSLKPLEDNGIAEKYEMKLTSQFHEFAEGLPKRIHLNYAIRLIHQSGVFPSDWGYHDILNEFFIRHYDIRYGFLKDVLPKYGGKKLYANSAGSLDASDALPGLTLYQFKDLLRGMWLIGLELKLNVTGTASLNYSKPSWWKI